MLKFEAFQFVGKMWFWWFYSLLPDFLSFSIKNSWNSLSQTKCKLWDDKELDVLEGAKFFSYFLG